MAKFSIQWSEVKKKGETNGRPWQVTEMTLKDENGVITEKVSTFDAVMTGAEIEGDIVPNGQYLNFKKKLEAPNFIKSQRNAGIEKAMEKKEHAIEKFQDNKDWSIKVSSTMNKAVELAVAENTHPTLKLEDRIIYWREWLWKHWDDANDFPPF